MRDLERTVAKLNPSASLETEEYLASQIAEIIFSSRFEPILRADSKRSIEEAARRSRIWKWIKDSKAFATISAYKSNLPKEENRRRMGRLLIKLRRKGLGVIGIQGYGQEGGIVSKERGFFVFIPPESDMSPETFRKFIEKLAKEFGQFAYVFGADGGKDIRLYVKTDGDYRAVERWNHTTFRPDYLLPDEDKNLYYSFIKGQPLQFQRKQVKEHTAFGYMNGLAFSSLSEKFKSKFGYSIYQLGGAG